MEKRPRGRPAGKRLANAVKLHNLMLNIAPDGEIWASNEFLAKEMGVCKRQIQRYLKDLKAVGRISTRAKRFMKGGAWKAKRKIAVAPDLDRVSRFGVPIYDFGRAPRTEIKNPVTKREPAPVYKARWGKPNYEEVDPEADQKMKELNDLLDSCIARDAERDAHANDPEVKALKTQRLNKVIRKHLTQGYNSIDHSPQIRTMLRHAGEFDE